MSRSTIQEIVDSLSTESACRGELRVEEAPFARDPNSGRRGYLQKEELRSGGCCTAGLLSSVVMARFKIGAAGVDVVEMVC
jgi:hypothetical protein